MLVEWQSQGFVKFIEPLALSLDFEPVIEVLGYIKES